MDDDSYWDAIKEAFFAVSIDSPTEFLTSVKKLPPYQADLLAAHWILSEVSNGGFHQFFFNSTGVLSPEAAAAFEHMELSEIASIVRDAMFKVGTPYPRERSERGPLIDAVLPDNFQDLESRLYSAGGDNLEKIYDVMDDYARRFRPNRVTKSR